MKARQRLPFLSLGFRVGLLSWAGPWGGGKESKGQTIISVGTRRVGNQLVSWDIPPEAGFDGKGVPGTCAAGIHMGLHVIRVQ